MDSPVGSEPVFFAKTLQFRPIIEGRRFFRRPGIAGQFIDNRRAENEDEKLS